MNLATITPTLARMSMGDLRALNEAVVAQMRMHHAQQAREAAAQFNVGDWVEFTNSRTGQVVRIRVERFNTKTLSGKTLSGQQWRVPPTMCRAVAG